MFNNRSFCRFSADLAWLISYSVHRDARFDFDYGLALVMVPRLLGFGGSGSEDLEVVSCVPVITFGVAIIASSVCVSTLNLTASSAVSLGIHSRNFGQSLSQAKVTISAFRSRRHGQKGSQINVMTIVLDL